jgi:hypothetical protein
MEAEWGRCSPELGYLTALKGSRVRQEANLKRGRKRGALHTAIDCRWRSRPAR